MKEKRKFFSIRLLHELLDSEKDYGTPSAFRQLLEEVLNETNELSLDLGKADRVSLALLKNLPTGLLYWFGSFSAIFWPIPGSILTIYASSLISKKIYKALVARKDREYSRTFLYYLLRMENADGVISEEEVDTLKAIIELMPFSANEKKEWLELISVPDSFKDLAVKVKLNIKQKTDILSAAWALALCDGLDEREAQMFEQFASELGVEAASLVSIKEGVVTKLTSHLDRIWVLIGFAYKVFPNLKNYSDNLSDMLVSLSANYSKKEENLKRLNAIFSAVGSDKLLEDTTLFSSLSFSPFFLSLLLLQAFSDDSAYDYKDLLFKLQELASGSNECESFGVFADELYRASCKITKD